MVPLPPYIAHLQPNLLAGFDDYRTELAGWLGYGYDSTQWTNDEVLELGRHIQEAYRWILYPQTIPGERIPHTWSWLEQTTTLVTTSDDYDYTMPADFGSLCGNYLRWGAGVTYDFPYFVNNTDFDVLRAFSSRSGRPECFTRRWAAQVAGSNQRQEILLYPTPDDTYTLYYTYAVLTGPLSQTNPYPLGGPRTSQLMMEAVRAIGENKKNGARGDQWATFISQMQSAIQLDKGTNTTRSLGLMSGDSSRMRIGPRTSGEASYYFGPYVDSSTYVLET